MKRFEDLPNRVQEASLEIMAQSQNKRDLIQNLENSEYLRNALGANTRVSRKEVDAIVRYATKYQVCG